MAWYPQAIRKNIPPPASDPRITARVVILHVAESEAESLYPYFNGGSGGVESHFYIRYDGTVEQYRDTAYQADANVDANDFAVSIETQGKGSGTWPAAQLAAIKRLILWCHATHNIPLVKCPAWNGSGIGYHTQYPDRWDKRGASCPGPNRIKQFNDVLVPWLATGGKSEEDELMAVTVKNPLTGEDWPLEKALWSIWTYATNNASAAADAVWAKPLAVPDNDTPQSAGAQLGKAHIFAYRTNRDLTGQAIAAAVSAGIKAAGGVDVDEEALAKAIVTEFFKHTGE